jgi:hypothetical protein
MTAQSATGSFVMKTWNETDYTAKEALPRLATVEAADTFSGAIEADTVVRYTIIYVTESTGSFVGMRTFTGSLDGREGSFTVREQGIFEGTTVSSRFEVVEGSGTGELVGLTGSGEFTAIQGEANYPYTFDYSLENA